MCEEICSTYKFASDGHHQSKDALARVLEASVLFSARGAQLTSRSFCDPFAGYEILSFIMKARLDCGCGLVLAWTAAYRGSLLKFAGMCGSSRVVKTLKLCVLA